MGYKDGMTTISINNAPNRKPIQFLTKLFSFAFLIFHGISFGSGVDICFELYGNPFLLDDIEYRIRQNLIF